MNSECRPRRSLFKRAARIMAIGFVPALMALLGGVGWIGSERAIHPAAQHYATTLADYPDLDSREIGFQSRTHVMIAAPFFPGVRRAESYFRTATATTRRRCCRTLSSCTGPA